VMFFALLCQLLLVCFHTETCFLSLRPPDKHPSTLKITHLITIDVDKLKVVPVVGQISLPITHLITTDILDVGLLLLAVGVHVGYC